MLLSLALLQHNLASGLYLNIIKNNDLVYILIVSIEFIREVELAKT